MKKQIQSAYDRLANSQPYQRVDLKLKIITWTVATISAFSTAYANGISHKAVIGTEAAWLLGAGIFLIVEFSLFTLEQGLRETFKGGTQRALASIGKWLIKATMVANAAYLCCMITGVSTPETLLLWNRWSFVIHFGIGLVLIPLIRDSDPVIAARMLQLRAETAQEDQIVSRLASTLASPFALAGARLRGVFDGLSLGWRLFRNKAGFSPRIYTENLNSLHSARFGHIEGQKHVGSGSTVRLSAPLPVAPFAVSAVKNKSSVRKSSVQNFEEKRKSSSVAGVQLPGINLIHFEPNSKGGIEAWFRPSRESPRSERVYLFHMGKKLLERLAILPDSGESEIRQMVFIAAQKKGIAL
jgi:hypothetical protein